MISLIHALIHMRIHAIHDKNKLDVIMKALGKCAKSVYASKIDSPSRKMKYNF